MKNLQLHITWRDKVKLKSMLHKLSYSAYRSPDKVAEITRGELKAEPILFYEKIAALLHLRPYFFGIILLIWGSIGVLLQWWENPEVWEITVSILTPEKRLLSHVLFCFSSLIFFYSLPYIKDTYFQTLQTLRPLISRAKYDELKEKLCRNNITYIFLGIISLGLILQISYEFYIGYKLGFWSENLPIWTGLRFGPISYLFLVVPVIPWLFFYLDIINEGVSWFYLPFAIKSPVKETARKDPEIFGNVLIYNSLL